VRGGAHETVPAYVLVPGDVVLLEAGNVVPADLRLIEAAQLRCEEAALTGESLAVEKHSRPLHEKDLPLGDRKNMAYSGTSVVYGRGSGVVVSTGADTELGKIASLLQESGEVKTPLQKRLATFGKKLGVAVLLICGGVFGIGVLRGEEPLLMALTAISLALGAKKLVRQHALVRKLPAVETLGSTTYICSDKTGTLTMNRMAVEEAWIGGRLYAAGQEADGETSGEFMKAIVLCNDAHEGAGGIMGDPTEVALYNYAGRHGFARAAVESEHPRTGEIPFDSERKAMTTMHAGPGGIFSVTKGAVDVLLDRSVAMLTASGALPLDRAGLQKAADRMAADGLRVLCVTRKNWEREPESLDPEEAERGLTVLGIIGIMDPPREEAKEAIELCKSAGIKPVMRTGDHPITARVIARRLGLIDDDARSIM
ncbi:hypothetical protein BAC2_02719, partial [uncultured bacterium]